MATEEATEPPAETRERQVSSYDDLNGLTFGALKRLASDNGIRLAKFPKKHDIIKQILIQAEDDDTIASAVAEAVPSAPHVAVTPQPVRQSSTETSTTRPQTQPSPTQADDKKHVSLTAERKEEAKETSFLTQSRFGAARQRAETTAIMSDTRRNNKPPATVLPNKRPAMRTVKTMGDVMSPRHRPRASSLPTAAVLDEAELFSMNFTQLKHHAIELGLEIPRVPTKGKILRMILAYQPDDLDADEDSGSEENVDGDEKEEQEDDAAVKATEANNEDPNPAVDESPPTEVPAAPAAIVHEENKPSDLMAMWRKKSQDSNGRPSPSPSPSPSPGSGGKKSGLAAMWQQRADADKSQEAPTVTHGPPKRGGGKVSKFAEKFANQNIPVGGSRPNRVKSPSPTPSISPTPQVIATQSNDDDNAAATEEKKNVEPQQPAAAEEAPATEEQPTSTPTTATESAAATEEAPAEQPPAAAATTEEKATEEKKEAEEANDGPPKKTREELDAMGFKALKLYIKNDLGLPLPRVPNRANCIKTILKHQSGEDSAEDEPKRKIMLKPKPKPKDVASEIGGTSIADRLKMIAASQANHGVPPAGGGGASASSAPKKKVNIGDRFAQQQQESSSASSAPVDARPKPKKKKKIGKIGGMGMAINIAALRPGFRPKPRARSSSMVTTQVEFQNLELLRPTIQSGRRKSRMKGPGRTDAAARILVEDSEMD